MLSFCSPESEVLLALKKDLGELRTQYLSQKKAPTLLCKKVLSKAQRIEKELETMSLEDQNDAFVKEMYSELRQTVSPYL